MSRLKDYENLIGGLSGGVLSTIVCHPMDLLKIRYSANEGSAFRPQYSSYWDAAVKITRSEGMRGLYQGLTPNLIGCAVSWGAYLHLYDWMRTHVSTPSTSLPHLINFSCAYVSSSIVMCFTNPIWVAKTRLCLQYESCSVKKYRGFTHCLSTIAKEEGVRGLYKGFVVGVIGAVHGAIQMMLYTYMKERRIREKNLPKDTQLPTTDYLLYSILSKVSAVTLTYPYQVVRTRIQDHNAAYAGIWKTVKSTLQGEGVQGLYKGLLMANIRTLPSTVIVFLTYENVRFLVKKL